MVPCALPVVFAPKFTHLFRQQHLVQIVHLLVRATVVVFHVRMIVDCPGRIQLESFYPLIHESGQVVHPVFLAGSVPALAQSHIVLLGDAQVIILAKPEAKVEAHRAQLADEQAVVQLLRMLVVRPVRFRREFVEIPVFLRREIVAFLHPLRLKPEYIARHVGLPEHDGIAQYVPLVLKHVRPEAKPVGPFWQDIATPRQQSIFIQDGRHVLAYEYIEVGFLRQVQDVEP